jgi:hypothetical protein
VPAGPRAQRLPPAIEPAHHQQVVEAERVLGQQVGEQQRARLRHGDRRRTQRLGHTPPGVDQHHVAAGGDGDGGAAAQVVLVGAAGAERDDGQPLEAPRLEREHARRHLVEAPGRTGEHPAPDRDGERDQQPDHPDVRHENTTVLLP